MKPVRGGPPFLSGFHNPSGIWMLSQFLLPSSTNFQQDAKGCFNYPDQAEQNQT
jgi:hypothetical protein